MKAIYTLTALLFIPLITISQGLYEKNGLTYDADGSLVNGKYIQTSEDDYSTKIINYNNGLLHGEFLVYASNGNLLERGKYIDGQKHGKWTNWSLEGTPI